MLGVAPDTKLVQRKARRPFHQGVIWATVNSDGRRQAPPRDREHADLRPGLEVLLSPTSQDSGREQDFQSSCRGGIVSVSSAQCTACASGRRAGPQSPISRILESSVDLIWARCTGPAGEPQVGRLRFERSRRQPPSSVPAPPRRITVQGPGEQTEAQVVSSPDRFRACPYSSHFT